MKSSFKSLALGAATVLLFTTTHDAKADITVGVDSGAPWIGYMNVFNLPSAGGAFQFGQPWGTADLCATFAGPVLTLTPNTIGDPSPYWYTPSGGPGAIGNKIMDANMYVENSTTYPGQTITFTGYVLANTLVSPYTSVAFIKDFSADYSSFTTITTPLTPGGAFSITLPTTPGTHVQYGFETIGPDVWITDVGPMGLVQITAVPEPAALSLLSLGILGMLLKRRQQ
jgi:PEP-CTERM motif